MKKINSLIINYIVTFLMFFYVGCRDENSQKKIVRKIRVDKIKEKKSYYDMVLNYRNDTIFKSFVFYKFF